MLEQLQSFLIDTIGIPQQDTAEFLDMGQLKTQPSGTYFISEGEVPKRLAFVLNGLFRYVYLTPRGDEYTKSFLLEGSIISSYSAMIGQQASAYSIEALEDSTLLEIRYRDWQRLLQQKPVWQKLLLRALEKGFVNGHQFHCASTPQ